MKVRSAIFLSIVVCFSLLVLGCPPVVTPPPDTTETTADDLADEAVALMKTQDWDGALSKFSEAVAKDPTNGRAVMGYSALNIASIMSDSSIVAMAKNKLGFANYPSTMNSVLSPSTWMVTMGNGALMPAITNESTYDGAMGEPTGDGIDPTERMIAFAAWFATHNSGFNELATTVGTALGTRLDAAISAIKAVDDSAKLTITWDMVMTSKPDSSSWPYGTDNQPMGITIGKAELLALASTMEVVRGFTYLAQVYSLSLPLGEYWTAYNPIDGDGATNDPANKPFETFLRLTSSASTQLAGAKGSYSSAISDFSSAATMVLTNRAGYFISTDATAGIFTDTTSWNNFTNGVRIAQRASNEVGNSITNKTPAIFPFDMSSVNPAAWPTSIVAGQTMGINYGIFFNSPINLFATVIELSTGTSPSGEAAGEPVYYRQSGTSFPVVTGTYLPSNGDFQPVGAETFSVRITDATFGGVVPLTNYPLDDPATQGTFAMTWSDTLTVNAKWDPGEVILNASYSPQIEGVADPAAGYGPDPKAYFTVPDALLVPYTNPANNAALRTQLRAMSTFYPASPVYLSSGALYLPLAPNWVAWNSFATKGTPGYDPAGVSITSAGSIWWALAKMLPWMIPAS